MLSNIMSNIILAVIAIVVIYTFAPLIKDMLFPSKKSLSKSDFDELVKRKMERLQAGSSVKVSGLNATEEELKNSVSKRRSDWDYLVENDFFLNDEELEKFQNLKSSLDWGSGNELGTISSLIKESISIEVEPNDLINPVKQLLTKSSMMKLYPNKEASLDSFLKICSVYSILSNLNITRSILSKKTSLTNEGVTLAILLTVEDKKKGQGLVDKFLKNQDLSIGQDTLLSIVSTINNPSALLTNLRKQVDIILPLIKVNSESLFSGNTEENKSKYKKLVSIYHPDKWIHFEKSELISKRLEENFNIVKEEYEKVK